MHIHLKSVFFSFQEKLDLLWTAHFSKTCEGIAPYFHTITFYFVFDMFMLSYLHPINIL